MTNPGYFGQQIRRAKLEPQAGGDPKGWFKPVGEEHVTLVGFSGVQSLCEYAENRMIAASKHWFAVIQDWKVTRSFKDPDATNLDKWSIAPLPGFDESTFPFFVCSGRTTQNLVNMKEGLT